MTGLGGGRGVSRPPPFETGINPPTTFLLRVSSGPTG